MRRHARRGDIGGDANDATGIVHTGYLAEDCCTMVPDIAADAVVVIVEDQGRSWQVLVSKAPAPFQVDEMHSGAIAVRLRPNPARIDTRGSGIQEVFRTRVGIV